MTTYIAFLRAVNVGGTGKLPMRDLRDMCEELGFAGVQTYIASGNLVLRSSKSAHTVKSMLEVRIKKYANKDVSVIVRSSAEVKRLLDGNPFPDVEPRFAVVFLLDDRPGEDALEKLTGQVDEEVRVGERAIYVHYPSGMGRSKLKIPATKAGTSRNLNTIRKMVELAT